MVEGCLLQLERPHVGGGRGECCVQNCGKARIVVHASRRVLGEVTCEHAYIGRIYVPKECRARAGCVCAEGRGEEDHPIVIPNVPAKERATVPHTIQAILRTLSCNKVRIRTSEGLTSLGGVSPVEVFCEALSTRICGKSCGIPVHLFFPARRSVRGNTTSKGGPPIVLFFRNNN